MTGAGTDRTRPLIGGGPAVVLVRPQLAVNIGMCARAMANFGLDDLRLVNPFRLNLFIIERFKSNERNCRNVSWL